MISRLAYGTCGQRFVLRPNCSASWREIKLFFAVLAILCLGIATAFSVAGLWPILPFAGLEISLLGLCLWLSARDGTAVEVININRRTVVIGKGERGSGQCWKFNRAWAQIRLERARIRQHPSNLLIGSHGKLVHCGRFLTEHERSDLARELKTAIKDGQLEYS